MTLGSILSRRGRQDTSKREKQNNKPLPKSTSCFGKLASLTIQRKKSNIKLKERQTIRRIYKGELDNMVMENQILNQTDDEDYSINEILSPYEDNNYSNADYSYIDPIPGKPLDFNAELPLIETIQCSILELADIANCSGKGPDTKMSSNKENDTPSSGSSIFERANSIVFDDDAMSHSTSRHSLLLLKETVTKNPNGPEIFGNEYIEPGSIIDANIEIFRTPADRLNLKLVSQSPTPLKTPSPMTRNIMTPTKENINKTSISFYTPPTKQERVTNVKNDIEQNLGSKENSQSKSDIHKKEMAFLLHEHKLILQKQEKEINTLKKLLLRERNINKILISGASKLSLSHSSPSKIQKTRNDCIPIDILSNENQHDNFCVSQSSGPRASESPFWEPANKQSKKSMRRKKLLRGFPIVPVLCHSNIDEALDSDQVESSSDEAREKGRMDAYHALTSSNQKCMDDKIIDYSKLNNVFGSNYTNSNKNRVKRLNYLPTPDFSSISLEIYA